MADIISPQDRDKWVCELCTKEDGMLSSNSRIMGDPLPSSADRAHYDGRHLASPSKFHNSSGWQAHSSKQKAVLSGKVRYITHEEVQQLYRTKSPIKSSVVFKTVAPKSPISRVNAPANVTRPKRGRPPKKQNISLSEQGSPFSSARTVTPPRRGRPPKMLSISKINQQASQVLKQSQEKWSPGTHTKGHGIEEQPKDAPVLSRGAEKSSRKIVKGPNKLSCTPSSSWDSSLNLDSGGETSAAERDHSDGEERDLLNTFSRLHLYRSYLPALQATWKGGFVIYADTPGEFIGGFQAQLPSKVDHRVYDFSQKMPPVLQATLLPRLHLWDDPFLNECPELEDVALYFFPDDTIASSRETYASLFEVMDTKDSVMRIYFAGVEAMELLIYTSKQLRLELLDTVPSLTCPRIQNFLWGIFRPGSTYQDMGDSVTSSDMEVDMVGGKMVGIVDVVVPKYMSIPSRMSQQPVTPIDSSTPSRIPQQPETSKEISTPSTMSQQPETPKELSTSSTIPQQSVTLKDSSTPGIMCEQLNMTPVQQLLRITREKHSSFADKKRALETAIAQLLGVESEEVKGSDSSTAAAMTTTLALQKVKSEKEEGEMGGTSSTVDHGRVKLEEEEGKIVSTPSIFHYGHNHN
ncbi:uncharacterized protein LOC126793987 [Argentina anserina]|uniref:uncharacterized protein LOC126793987 n=1 Tax=Argentina anserina TaxID=57926 RepID=UPI00217676F1|nr:uncharacterized protein LOC126793987 [Potentilla anserina]